MSEKKSSKLTPLEAKLYKLGLAAPNQTITQKELFDSAGIGIDANSQDAINALLRKSLVTMVRGGPNNEVSFRFTSKQEAKSMGEMDADEKLVFDQVKDAGNRGIWTKTIKSRTGLHTNMVNRALKALEGRKQIKPVKSVKFPTRKMVMLANLTPSAELTGGPWFTDNDLDTVFVELLQKCALKYIEDSTGKGLLPTTMTPFLPTVADVRRNLTELDIAHVDLLDEHIEALLDLMVFDGAIEKILVPNLERGGAEPSAKRKRKAKELEDNQVKKKKKKTTGASPKRKSRVESSDDSDDESDLEGASKKKRRKKRGAERSSSPSGSSSGSESDSEEASARRRKEANEEQTGSYADYGYRPVRQYKPRLGVVDMPCGSCPVEAFCTQPNRATLAATKVVSASVSARATAQAAGKPKLEIGFGEHLGLPGIGMLGGAGAAIGVSNERSGMSRGATRGGVAPVNPEGCPAFTEWLIF